MKKDAREIYQMFAGKLVGNSQMKKYICETLLLFPDEIIKHVTSKCWFFGSMDDAFAFTFTGNDLKDQHLVFLSDELFLYSAEQILYTIAHEIGHVMLGHRNSTLVHQSKEEIKQQEKEADEFAKSILLRALDSIRTYYITRNSFISA